MMKKSLFAPLLCVIMLLIMPCMNVCAYTSSSPDGAVFDEADFLTDAQESELTAYAQNVADSSGWNVLVYVTD
ncbi:MAG: TPM domain-containing protein, partial [Oscillospiraceae bacterium]|nr:TPM domain-containing protein [Oscillospiraceae bacterium]